MLKTNSKVKLLLKVNILNTAVKSCPGVLLFEAVNMEEYLVRHI